MSDIRLRSLERAWLESADEDARLAYERFRARKGLEPRTLPIQPTGGKLTATIVYGPGHVSFWGGNGRRWDADAGCVFARLLPGMTLGEIIDAWVEDFTDGSDWDEGPDWLEDTDVRHAIHATLSPEGWKGLHLDPNEVSELAPAPLDYFGGIKPDDGILCEHCDEPAGVVLSSYLHDGTQMPMSTWLPDDTPLPMCLDCAEPPDEGPVAIVLLEIVETPITELARQDGWYAPDFERYVTGAPTAESRWVDTPPDPGDSFSFSQMGTQETGEPNPAGYLMPDYLGGSDYSGGLICRSNYQTFIEEFGEVPCVHDVHGGYGSYAVAIRIGCVCEQMGPMAESIASLSGYPVLDDEHLSNLEMEEDNESWESWARSEFLSELESKFPGLETEDCDDANGDVRWFFESVREAANEYWETDGESRHVRIDSIVWGLNGKVGGPINADPYDDGVTLDDVIEGVDIDNWEDGKRVPKGLPLKGATYDPPSSDEIKAFKTEIRDERIVEWATRYGWHKSHRERPTVWEGNPIPKIGPERMAFTWQKGREDPITNRISPWVKPIAFTITSLERVRGEA